MSFSHAALNLRQDKSLIYTAHSKHYFYYRVFISKYVLEQHKVPLNPFMIFDYFLFGAVDPDLVREGNNNLVKRCDEVWVFGPISDGVLAEIKLAKEIGRPVKYFAIEKPHRIIPIEKEAAILEENVEPFRAEL